MAPKGKVKVVDCVFMPCHVEGLLASPNPGGG